MFYMWVKLLLSPEENMGVEKLLNEDLIFTLLEILLD
jgi:hypothetical protein